MNVNILLACLLAAASSLGGSARSAGYVISEEKEVRLFASLETRCKRMFLLQTAVNEGMEDLRLRIEARPGRQPLPEDRQFALKLAEKQKVVIRDADKATELLEKEGAAVAFPEVFRQVRDDMKLVQQRLEKLDLGPKTHVIGKDVADTLWEMVYALKKA
jgi:hypothetical protein